jgi:hypothetical protein
MPVDEDRQVLCAVSKFKGVLSQSKPQSGTRQYHLFLCSTEYIRTKISQELGGHGSFQFTTGLDDFDILHLSRIAESGATGNADTPENAKCWSLLEEAHDKYNSTNRHVWVVSNAPCVLVWPKLFHKLQPLFVHGLEDTAGRRLVKVRSIQAEEAFCELDNVAFEEMVGNMPVALQNTSSQCSLASAHPPPLDSTYGSRKGSGESSPDNVSQDHGHGDGQSGSKTSKSVWL